MNLNKTALGIEFGSTRIKSVLLDEKREVIAKGSYTWENKFENGIWTYDLTDAIIGMQQCFAQLKRDFENKYDCILDEIGAIGISGMMHGFLAFDADWKLLTPFRTWRNTITAQAAEELSKAFNFNIPQRWSIAHLYKDIAESKAYVKDIRHLTTLSGYIHHLLTGVNVLGVGEASGMFPIDTKTKDYSKDLLDIFDNKFSNGQLSYGLKEILPEVSLAGEISGRLTEEGARILDPTGTLKSGIVFAPPEGDAGTGMVATNSIKLNTGNVSAGTSVFAMVVTDNSPKNRKEVDIVTTPCGSTVAMIHCNNCTSDINGWVNLFYEFSELLGVKTEVGNIYELLFKTAEKGSLDCGDLLSYNYLSGEGITDVDSGVPIFLRKPDANFTLADFMRTHIYSSLVTLKIGLDLLKQENVVIDSLFAHGGLFKTPYVAQKILSAATGCSVITADTAGEGGPYGMALLASYLLDESNDTLEDYLENTVFSNIQKTEVMATAQEIAGFNKFTESYKKAFVVEKTALEVGLC